MDDRKVRRAATMSELFEYLQQIVFEVESGRLKAADARRRMIADWGGMTVRGYIPLRDPQERIQVRTLMQSGIPERTARAKVRGK
jgi:hypothetical protein